MVVNDLQTHPPLEDAIIPLWMKATTAFRLRISAGVRSPDMPLRNYTPWIRWITLSLLTVGLLLSGLGFFQSHGLTLIGTQGQEANEARHADQAHEHAQDETLPVINSALHVHGSDSASQGHNPLDHSHDTPSLPPLISEMKSEIKHHFAALPERNFTDCDPIRLERPPMKALTI